MHRSPAAAGRDVQTLEAHKADLQRENDLLRAELAALRALPRLTQRARALGFQPAAPDQIDYLAVSDYPTEAQTPTLPPVQPKAETTLTEWLAEALTGVLPHWTLPTLPALPALPGGG